MESLENDSITKKLNFLNVKGKIKMKSPFERIVERASQFVNLDDKSSQEMLKAAINHSSIDMDKLLSFDDFNFKHDILGLYKNFDFGINKCKNNFLPKSHF